MKLLSKSYSPIIITRTLGVERPDGTFKLTISVTNLWKKIVTFMWFSSCTMTFSFAMLKAEFVTPASLKVPSGCRHCYFIIRREAKRYRTVQYVDLNVYSKVT